MSASSFSLNTLPNLHTCPLAAPLRMELEAWTQLVTSGLWDLPRLYPFISTPLFCEYLTTASLLPSWRFSCSKLVLACWPLLFLPEWWWWWWWWRLRRSLCWFWPDPDWSGIVQLIHFSGKCIIVAILESTTSFSRVFCYCSDTLSKRLAPLKPTLP